jgi:hypothetical protein
MHIDIVPNRGGTPTVLLRKSYREHGKTKKQTVANLSDRPPFRRRRQRQCVERIDQPHERVDHRNAQQRRPDGAQEEPTPGLALKTGNK